MTTRFYSGLAQCPDCGQEVGTLGHMYAPHTHPAGWCRVEVCTASRMPVVTEERPLVPRDATGEAWEGHVRGGGD